jgi:hypothetical protein
MVPLEARFAVHGAAILEALQNDAAAAAPGGRP